jgi:hypothetical protein
MIYTILLILVFAMLLASFLLTLSLYKSGRKKPTKGDGGYFVVNAVLLIGSLVINLLADPFHIVPFPYRIILRAVWFFPYSALFAYHVKDDAKPQSKDEIT